MKVLYIEITRRFPEVQTLVHEGDEELPYLVIGLIVDWLRSLSPAQITPEIVSRILEFRNWCEQKPRGKDAGDDIYTIWVVGFCEELFENDVTRPLIPRLMSKDDLKQNAEYLKT